MDLSVSPYGYRYSAQLMVPLRPSQWPLWWRVSTCSHQVSWLKAQTTEQVVSPRVLDLLPKCSELGCLNLLPGFPIKGDCDSRFLLWLRTKWFYLELLYSNCWCSRFLWKLTGPFRALVLLPLRRWRREVSGSLGPSGPWKQVPTEW